MVYFVTAYWQLRRRKAWAKGKVLEHTTNSFTKSYPRDGETFSTGHSIGEVIHRSGAGRIEG